MDEEIDRFRDILEVNRTEIVRTIDPDKLFHVLRACRIFDQEDQEEISSQVNYPTLQKRAGRFLDILATKGPNAFDVFCKSLEGTYPHLYKLLTNKEASEFLPVEPDSTCSTVVHEEFSYLAQKYEKLANEKQQLVTRCNKLVNEAVKMRTENERFKKKAEILQYQKALNKNLKKANRDWEEKLYQATEEKYNAVKRSLDYQEATKLAQEKLREALMTIDDMKRELHKAEGEFKLQRTRTTRLQNELNVKPKTHEIDEYKREIRLLKAELTQIRSTQTVRNSMVLECVDERMAILEKEREEARTELKEMVDALYEARQECHAAELQRDQFLEKTEKLEQEIETLQKDCETYLNRKDELWKQLLEREKERNTAIKERDNALRDWTIKTQERDDIFGRFYKLQEKYDTLEQQLRMIRSNTCYMDSESEPSLGNQTPAQNEDESSFSNNIWHRPRSKRLAHRQISVTESAPENEMPDYDVAFADFRAFRSDDDTSLSCKVHPSSSSRRVLESKKIFSSTTEFDQLSFDSSELSDDNVFPLKIKRRHCNRRRKRFRPRSNSCTNLDVDLEKMLHNSSSDGHSSVYSVQSLRTSHNSNTSGYTSIASNTDYFDVLLSDTTMMDIEITGGNSTGIFIKSVKIESRVACDINVGDQVIKIMGKINGQQKKQSFIDLTLEEAVELMNSCSGAMKLTLKHSQVVYEALRYMDTADVRGDSFYVTFGSSGHKSLLATSLV
ncbi:caspase recruitment domain-containing protein 11-like [Saccoglossus kowalevskii]